MSARTEAVHRWARLEIGEGGDSDDEFLAEVSELWVVALRLGLRPEDDDANASVATWENLMAALKQARPDAPYAVPVKTPAGVLIDVVGDGNRKDIRNAVEAANKAAPGWGKRAAHNRAQICFFIAENLEIRREEFASRLSKMTGKSEKEGLKEVDASISRLFTWAAWADKFGGTVQETTLYGATVQINEPVGVIGIACPTECPLLGFISLVMPAVVRGNAVVVVPSEKHPLCATDLYQVLDTSDLPGGVINIVTGQRDVLSRTLVEHQEVDSMWYFGDAKRLGRSTHVTPDLTPRIPHI